LGQAQNFAVVNGKLNTACLIYIILIDVYDIPEHVVLVMISLIEDC
jgi:hypothetical protein